MYVNKNWVFLFRKRLLSTDNDQDLHKIETQQLIKNSKYGNPIVCIYLLFFFVLLIKKIFLLLFSQTVKSNMDNF